MLATGGVRWKGRGRGSRGKASGEIVQVVELGPKSRKAKGRGRMTGYPVYIPGHVNERAYVRSYIFGGAALDAHTKAKSRGYSKKKYKRRRVRKNSRRTSMRKNRRRRRRSSRRRTTRRNPKYVVANRRRRKSRKSSRRGRGRRLRRNQFLNVDWMKDVVTPVLGGTAGFVAARVLTNSVANIEAVRNILDKDKPAAEAANTKIAANLLGIIATLGLATKVKMVKDNQGALITGMGLALTDRLLGKLTGPAQEYLSGFGEYVNQPLGEYVNQPLGAYVNDPGMGTMYATAGMGETLYAAAGVGEYVNQPLGLYAEGVDPANQAGVDSLMDVMEAAAGVTEAAAGVGTMYATAGLGAESDAGLRKFYQDEQPPFTSIQTPTDIARIVAKTRPADAMVPSSLVTPEGKGYAGGLFARNLFAGMF